MSHESRTFAACHAMPRLQILRVYGVGRTAVLAVQVLVLQSTGQRLQRPMIAFDAWLLALGR
jgi:hypothetical protein